jgi:hypothetical protein
MLIAHYGVGMAMKRVAPEVSTGLLVAASAGPDILFGVFAILGVETAGNPSPLSHGLFMSAVASAAVFLIAAFAYRKAWPSIALAATFFSHWVLDFISHPMGLGKQAAPDLFLFFEGSPLVGLGLYNSVAAALITELGLFAAGIALYAPIVKGSGRRGWLLFIALIACMIALIPLNALIPPAFAGWGCLAQLALLPLGDWTDRRVSESLRA